MKHIRAIYYATKANFRGIEAIAITAITLASILEFLYIRPIDRHITLYQTATVLRVNSHYLRNDIREVDTEIRIGKSHRQADGKLAYTLSNEVTPDTIFARNLVRRHKSSVAELIEIAGQIHFARIETSRLGSKYTDGIGRTISELILLKAQISTLYGALSTGIDRGEFRPEELPVLPEEIERKIQKLQDKTIQEGYQLIQHLESDKKTFNTLFSALAWIGSILLVFSKILNWRKDVSKSEV